MKKIIVLSALLAAAVTVAGGVSHVAHAQEPGSRTVLVHYGDLDLASDRGRDALSHRLHQAVWEACGSASPADLQGRNEVAGCRRDLMAALGRQRDAVFAGAAETRGNVLAARR